MRTGYGRSTVTRNAEDYAQEQINLGMLALLDHLDRETAIWIGVSMADSDTIIAQFFSNLVLMALVGHDWGCGSVWSFAAHYPQKCVGVAALTIPYRTLDRGLEELIKYVNRDIYPADEYPFGQWSYMRFYETSFEKATEWLEADIASFLRKMYSKGDPAGYGKPAAQATVMRDGGRAGGSPKPDPNWKHIPISDTVLDEETYAELVTSMRKTGFWGADAWYINHQRNREYSLRSEDNGYLRMPVLFIGARFDPVCDTSISRLCEPMRKHCANLTECTIDSGHWVAQEKPAETNAAISRWLIESCETSWPGYWAHPHVKNKE